MKHLFTILFLSLLSFSIISAQDMESVTNIYNSGAVALNEGKKAEALKLFEDALAQALVIGPEAEAIATNCKNTIPTIIMAIGKEQTAAKEIDNAIITLKKALEKATEYGDQNIIDEVQSLIPQIYASEGNSKLNDGDFAGAIEMYKKSIEYNPNDGIVYLRMGMAASRINDEAGTLDALEKAAKNGQEEAANKELSKYYLRSSIDAYKNKDLEKAYDFAIKSVESSENAQAYSIAGKTAISLKKYAEAVKAFESYLSLNPKAKDANATMYQLAVSLEAIGEKDKACGYYKQIMADPQFKEYATHKVTVELKCQ